VVHKTNFWQTLACRLQQNSAGLISKFKARITVQQKKAGKRRGECGNNQKTVAFVWEKSTCLKKASLQNSTQQQMFSVNTATNLEQSSDTFRRLDCQNVAEALLKDAT